MERKTIGQLGADPYDILVVGGGITGAATARDAALRGLRVALVEKNDFAWGTSSRSTKLLHGGLRYLERFEFRMVRQACRERERMLTLAPHLSHPRQFLYLQYDGYPEGMLKLKAGLLCYDVLAGAPRSRRHKMFNADALLRMEPNLNPRGLKGCGAYYDFLTDDARLTIETVKGAAEAGAHVANHTKVCGFLETNGRISGAALRDELTGGEGSVLARQVINAGGPWMDDVRFLEAGVRNRRLRPTKGVHIVLSKENFPLHHAVFLRSPRDGRIVWPIPALEGDLVYVGTTDTDYDGPLDNVIATDDDIDYLLDVANHTIPGRNLGREHVIATWAGLRPLLQPQDQRSPSTVSREHEIFVSSGGLLSIGGGKLTTARIMGLDAVDRAVQLLGEHHGIRNSQPSVSHLVPLSGGDPDRLAEAMRRLADLGLPDAVRDRLLARYGSNALHLAQMIQETPAAAVGMGGDDITAAEVHYAVLHEMARTLSDFLARRVSLFHWRRDGGLSIARPVASEMAGLLDWSPEETASQVTAYANLVSANRCAPLSPR